MASRKPKVKTVKKVSGRKTVVCKTTIKPRYTGKRRSK